MPDFIKSLPVFLILASLLILALISLPASIPDSANSQPSQENSQPDTAEGDSLPTPVPFLTREQVDKRRADYANTQTGDCLSLSIAVGGTDDFIQQCRMAVAAEDMALWSLLQIGVGIVGIALLYLTTIYTKDAAKTTKETLAVVQGNSKAELRAYMAADIGDFQQRYDPVEDGFGHSNSYIEWKNVGVTPAYRVQTAFQYNFPESIDVPAAEFSDPRPDQWREHGDKGRDQKVFHIGEIYYKMGNIEIGSITVRFLIQYEDVFKRTIKQSIVADISLPALAYAEEGQEIAMFLVGNRNVETITESAPVAVAH